MGAGGGIVRPVQKIHVDSVGLGLCSGRTVPGRRTPENTHKQT